MLPDQRRSWKRWRRAVQFAVAIFYLALPLLHLMEVRAVAGTLTALRIGPVDLVEPSAALSAVVASRQVTLALAIGTLPVILLALLLGPVFCSWVCPWGLISEGIDHLGQKLRRKPWKSDSWVAMRRPRAFALGGLLAAGAIAGAPLASLVSAPRIVTTLPLEAIYLRIVSPVTGGLLLALLLLEIFGPRRLWCRALCPAGAAAAWLRTPRTLAVRFDESTCICPRTAPCHITCPWGIDPRKKGTFDACTNCMTCVDACPTGSLKPRW